MTSGSSGKSRKRASQAGRAGRKGGRRTRPRNPFRRPVFRFVVLLLIILGAFEALLLTSWMKENVISHSLRFYADMSGTVLSLLGEEVQVNQSVISSHRFSVNIKKGCDAVQPIALFIAAVLASPVLGRSKLPGLFFGLLFLVVMNLVRVVSLFYVGIYFDRKYFDMMHHDVWQATFIVLAILAWAAWALWAAKRTVRTAHEPA